VTAGALIKVKDVRIIVVTGLSGSGKSTAMAAFEDAGCYCVDNLPVALLPKLLELPLDSEAAATGLVFVMDLREKGFVQRYPAVFDTLGRRGIQPEVIFLEAEEPVLVQRYSATRRQHPLGQDRPLREAIAAEAALLAPLRATADRIIDTSHLNVHQLKALMFEVARQGTRPAALNIHVISFGFRQGLPHEADLVVDVRFLTNPFFDPALRPLDGESEPIRRFVRGDPEAAEFLRRYGELLDYLIPLYEKEGKAYLTIAVGCTGGRHRSVVMARAIFEHLQTRGKRVSLAHRDIGLAGEPTGA
jgi:UPF0042 nucleotide-binding protein